MTLQNSPARIDKNLLITCSILALGIGWLVLMPLGPWSAIRDPAPTHYFEISGKQILLETAVTDQEKRQGLKGRSSLPMNRGMLFTVNPEQVVQLWMAGVRFPLDMVFLHNEKVSAVLRDVPPCSTSPGDCPIYPSGGIVDSVIELAAGTADSLYLAEGSTIKILGLD
ncbi:DUF192 domain-containing protein [Nodosilinea sp. LEGE 06152]|uniref:DUF192 domain-containing protein n=1 Tax=Nodosilinea sp. LEGE 06152 TaxID=2777966 RepID=UPI003242B097